MATKSKPDGANEGAPRWTYWAAAVVAAGGLLWGIVSYFIPKPQLSKSAATASAPTVSVSGQDNVGVGTMSGGQISVGTPAVPPPAAGAPSGSTSKP